MSGLVGSCLFPGKQLAGIGSGCQIFINKMEDTIYAHKMHRNQKMTLPHDFSIVSHDGILVSVP
jgi:hypothetical protein